MVRLEDEGQMSLVLRQKGSLKRAFMSISIQSKPKRPCCRGHVTCKGTWKVMGELKRKRSVIESSFGVACAYMNIPHFFVSGGKKKIADR